MVAFHLLEHLKQYCQEETQSVKRHSNNRISLTLVELLYFQVKQSFIWSSFINGKIMVSLMVVWRFWRQPLILGLCTRIVRPPFCSEAIFWAGKNQTRVLWKRGTPYPPVPSSTTSLKTWIVVINLYCWSQQFVV